MKLLRVVLFASFSVAVVSAQAENRSRDAAIGGGLGGALGGYIGSEAGGRTGGIIGSAAGAALGSAITTNTDSYDGSRRRHEQRYNDYRPRYKHHKKCPPGLAMQGRC